MEWFWSQDFYKQLARRAAARTKTKTKKAHTNKKDLTVCKELARIIIATKTKIPLGKSHHQLLVVTLKFKLIFTALVSSTVFVVGSFYNVELLYFHPDILYRYN